MRRQQPRRCRLAKMRVGALALVPGGGGGGHARRALRVGGCRWVSVGVGVCRWVSAWGPSATERPNACVWSLPRRPPRTLGCLNVLIVPIVLLVLLVVFLQCPHCPHCLFPHCPPCPGIPHRPNCLRPPPPSPGMVGVSSAAAPPRRPTPAVLAQILTPHDRPPQPPRRLVRPGFIHVGTFNTRKEGVFRQGGRTPRWDGRGVVAALWLGPSVGPLGPVWRACALCGDAAAPQRSARRRPGVSMMVNGGVQRVTPLLSVTRLHV